MLFFNREGENPPFEFDGYRVRLASGTSFFRGDTHSDQQLTDDVWSELQNENYRLIGNTLFTIAAAEKRQDVLSGIPPKLHIELTLQNKKRWYKEGYVVLILDNDRRSLVDWAVASPTPDTSHFLEQDPNNVAIYFDIPLLPVTKQSAQAEKAEILPDDHLSLWDRISQWGNGQQLTFGVFSFEEKDTDFYFPHLYHMWHPHLFHPDIRMVTIGFVDYIAKKADLHLKYDTGGVEQLQVMLEDGNTRPATTQDLQQMQGKVLLLCHGILSNTKGAFAGILSDPTFLASLHERYRGNILAWDHFTLSKTTDKNAKDLLDQISELHDVDLDIICHSRGAGVARYLVENNINRSQLATQRIREALIYSAASPPPTIIVI